MFALEDTHTSRRRPLRVAVAIWSAVALAALSALALRHGSSPKPEVLVPRTTTIHCGDTITVSIVVANDIGPCPTGTNGLNVGHGAITINLNGHTLAGHGDGTGVGVDIHIFPTVTIENGTISAWAVGVIANGLTNKVIGIRSAANSQFGIEVLGPGSSATGNVVFSNSGPGIVVQGTTQKVTSNVVRENTDGILLGGSGTVVQTNQAENNSLSGISDHGSGDIVTGNVTNANGGQGIYAGSDPTATIAANTANYNTGYGIEALPSGKDGGGNLAKGNGQATQCKDVICS